MHIFGDSLYPQRLPDGCHSTSLQFASGTISLRKNRDRFTKNVDFLENQFHVCNVIVTQQYRLEPRRGQEHFGELSEFGAQRNIFPVVGENYKTVRLDSVYEGVDCHLRSNVKVTGTQQPAAKRPPDVACPC